MVGSEIFDVYHFHNGSGGGVMSVISNLIKFSTSPHFNHHVIYTVNKKLFNNYKPNNIAQATSQTVFYYDPASNFYYNCRRLAKLLPNRKALIVAHDWFELGMVSNLGLQNPVVYFLHGDYKYYYQLAQKHFPSINHFIGVSSNIRANLVQMNIVSPFNTHHCRFPVPNVGISIKTHKPLHVFYGVRSLADRNKRFDLIPEIDSKLKVAGITVNWVIVGDSTNLNKSVEGWCFQDNVAYYREVPNEQVLKLLSSCHIFILPSVKEGFPVSLVEAMKAGLVPLVTNWDGAVDELIIPNETGYYVNIGDTETYASIIANLNANIDLLDRLSVNAQNLADKLFDPFLNVELVEEVYHQSIREVKCKEAFKVYGSTLDQYWLPNFFTSTFRKTLSTVKSFFA